MAPQESVGLTIRTLSNLMRRQFMRHQPPPEHRHCSDAGGFIMEFLCNNPDQKLCQHDISQIFCIRRSTASRILAALEQDGLIERVSAPEDARRKLLIPTAKALDIHTEVAANQDAIEARMREGIPPEELRAFLATARKIEANLAC